MSSKILLRASVCRPLILRGDKHWEEFYCIPDVLLDGSLLKAYLMMANIILPKDLEMEGVLGQYGKRIRATKRKRRLLVCLSFRLTLVDHIVRMVGDSLSLMN